MWIKQSADTSEAGPVGAQINKAGGQKKHEDDVLVDASEDPVDQNQMIWFPGFSSSLWTSRKMVLLLCRLPPDYGT